MSSFGCEFSSEHLTRSQSLNPRYHCSRSSIVDKFRRERRHLRFLAALAHAGQHRARIWIAGNDALGERRVLEILQINATAVRYVFVSSGFRSLSDSRKFMSVSGPRASVRVVAVAQFVCK